MDLVARLEGLYTGIVHDIMRGLGMRDFTLPPQLRPLFPEQRLAGRTQVVSGRVETGASADETLLAWTGLLSKARPDRVLINQPNDSTVALMGELSAETLKLKGVRGYVADGGCRDVEFILRLGFPVWCRFFTPRDIVGYWLPDTFDEPIEIGRVMIRTDDLVLGDRDGMVVLPAEHAETIVERAEAAVRTENKVRTAILAGMDPQEAYRAYGKF